jgi:hypothetical protein
MPNIFEITQLAVRTLEISVRGVKVQVVERLMRDPKAVIHLRNKANTLREVYQQALTKARSGEASDPYAGLETQIAQLELASAEDSRFLAVSAIVSRVESWDFVDAKGKPIPLSFEALYSGEFFVAKAVTAPIPTELFQELLEAIDKEPIVPNGKG